MKPMMARTKTSRKTLPAGVARVLKRLHYPLEVILLCVRWYLAYSLSLRDLEAMMAEQGFEIDHSSVHRWMIKLVPLLEKAFRKHKRPVGKSWRMDETYVNLRGQWKYLYRAVDKAGSIVDFLLRAHRDKAAAHRYFERAIGQNGAPETVTLDKSGANLAALQAINAERETAIKVQQVKYLNNIVEQDHRAIKRRIRPMMGFKDFRCARIILSGIETMHMIRKGQMKSDASRELPPSSSIRWSRKESLSRRNFLALPTLSRHNHPHRLSSGSYAPLMVVSRDSIFPEDRIHADSGPWHQKDDMSLSGMQRERLNGEVDLPGGVRVRRVGLRTSSGIVAKGHTWIIELCLESLLMTMHTRFNRTAPVALNSLKRRPLYQVLALWGAAVTCGSASLAGNVAVAAPQVTDNLPAPNQPAVNAVSTGTAAPYGSGQQGGNGSDGNYELASGNIVPSILFSSVGGAGGTGQDGGDPTGNGGAGGNAGAVMLTLDAGSGVNSVLSGPAAVWLGSVGGNGGTAGKMATSSGYPGQPGAGGNSQSINFNQYASVISTNGWNGSTPGTTAILLSATGGNAAQPLGSDGADGSGHVTGADGNRGGFGGDISYALYQGNVISKGSAIVVSSQGGNGGDGTIAYSDAGEGQGGNGGQGGEAGQMLLMIG
jgi:putative transposase